jgi:hypothetical protein
VSRGLVRAAQFDPDCRLIEPKADMSRQVQATGSQVPEHRTRSGAEPGSEHQHRSVVSRGLRWPGLISQQSFGAGGGQVRRDRHAHDGFSRIWTGTVVNTPYGIRPGPTGGRAMPFNRQCLDAPVRAELAQKGLPASFDYVSFGAVIL